MHIAQGYAQDQLENQLKEVVKRRGSPFLFGLRNIPSKIHRTSMSHHAQNNHKCIHRPLICYILPFSHFGIFTLWRWLRLTLSYYNMLQGTREACGLITFHKSHSCFQLTFMSSGDPDKWLARGWWKTKAKRWDVLEVSSSEITYRGWCQYINIFLQRVNSKTWNEKWENLNI